MRILLTLCIALFSTAIWAQKDKVVQVSGVVVTQDSSKQFIPNARIYIAKRQVTTTSGPDGFFSIPAVPGDTIYISHFGFKPGRLYIPDTLTLDGYLAIVPLEWNRVELQEVVLYPWPTPENLNRELLAMNIPTTEQDIANRNLAMQSLKERAAAMGYDAREMQDFAISMHNQRLYNYNRYYGANGGAAVLGALSNPFAWAEFFEALKRGDFSN